MNKDDIYDHLAQVYLGKRQEKDPKKKKEFNAWILINVFITIIIFSSAFYGLTAFLTRHDSALNNKIFFALNNGPVQLSYNFKDSSHPFEQVSLGIPEVDVSRYSRVRFSIRGKEEGSPGIVKIVMNNKRNETASYYIQGVNLSWQDFDIPLNEFHEITDWTSMTDLSFVLESWNVDKKKGLVLIDDVNFAGTQQPE